MSTFPRLAVLLAILLPVLSGGVCGGRGGALLPASAGSPEFRDKVLLPMPAGHVNVAGGNLLVTRSDLSIDTRLGTRSLDAVWNSADRTWRWSFDLRYDGGVFLDHSGAIHDLTAVADGEALPGSVWVRLDATRLRTKGGLVHEFDAVGRLASVRWASAAYPRLEYESADVAGGPRTVAIRQCRGPDDCSDVFAIQHDAQGRVEAITDRAGRRCEYDYDASGRLVAARNGLDVSRGEPGFRYEYDGDLLSALTNSEGERVSFAYAGARVTRVARTGPGAPVWTFDYLAQTDGLYETRVHDPVGHETRFRYDGDGRLHERILPATGETVAWAWQGRRVVRESRPHGVVTTWAWSDDDVAHRTDPSGNTTHFSYAPSAVNRGNPWRRPVLQVGDDLGPIETRAYDAAGRLVSLTDRAGDITLFQWDAEEMLFRITAPTGVYASFIDYGDDGHPRTASMFGQSVTLAYDAVGNRTAGTEPWRPERPGVVGRDYDAARNVARIHVIDTDTTLVDQVQGNPTVSEEVVLEYRSDGQPRRITRPGGGDHEFVYDAWGRRVERREYVDGIWRSTTLEYDATGRPTAETLPNGMRSEVDWGPDGRLAAMRWSRGGVLEGTAVYSYDQDRLVSYHDSIRGGSETYAYDTAGRLVTITFPDGEVLDRGYDARSRIERETYLLPGGVPLRQIETVHDGADRVVEVRDGGVAVLDRSYVDGRLDRVTTGNGLVRRYVYHPGDGRLTSIYTLNAANEFVESIGLLWAEAPLSTPWLQVDTQIDDGSGTLPVDNQIFFMAPSHTGAWAGSGQRFVVRQDWFDADLYAYDVLGNRTRWERVGENPIPVRNYVYNAESNRLLRIEDDQRAVLSDYAYDEAGFVVSRKGETLDWTASGRIRSIGTQASFIWDTLQRPVSQTVGGQLRRWRFGGRVQCDGAGNPLVLDLIDVVIDLASGERRYRHLDQRGNVRFVSDESGSVISHYAYDGYGEPSVFGDASDPVRFVARPQVGELMLLGARVYDPEVGRFLSPDPIVQAINQYSYAEGNPLWFEDRSGYTAELAIAEYQATVAAIILTLGVSVRATGGNPLITAAVFSAAGLAWYVAWLSLQQALDQSSASAPSVAQGGGGAMVPGGGAGGGGAGGAGGAANGATGAGGAQSGAGGGARGGVGGGVGSIGFGCTPTALADPPRLTPAFWALLPIQAFLAALLWRRRRRP